MWEFGEVADLAFQDTRDPVDNHCAVWRLRTFAVAALLSGIYGAGHYAQYDVSNCPNAPAITSFWASMQSFGGMWVAFDCFACAFCLRCLWLLPRVGCMGRIFGLVAWFISLYGFMQYCLILPHRRCWGPFAVLVLMGLSTYLLICLTWWAGSSGWWRGWLEVREWLACGEESEEDASKLELQNGIQHTSTAEVAELAIGASGVLADARSSARRGTGRSGKCAPEPALIGKRRLGSRDRHDEPATDRGQQRAVREIRVLRGGKVIHVGRSRPGVKRWLRLHLRDRRGVLVEDLARAADCQAAESPPDSQHS